MIGSTKIIDNGITHSQPARYEQHFEDGTVILSDTMPDRNAFKAEVKRPTLFAIGDTVDIADETNEPFFAMNPWRVYGVELGMGKIFYKIESPVSGKCFTFKEEALKIHAT